MKGTRPQESSSATRVRTELNRRFPGHKAAAEKLIKKCEQFRELCEDYLECIKVLRRFEDLGDTTQQRIAEYEDLQADLEREMLECLEARATCPLCGKKHVEKAVDP